LDTIDFLKHPTTLGFDFTATTNMSDRIPDERLELLASIAQLKQRVG